MKTYKGKIEHLESHQVFVFGSNTEGRHGKGAALWARQHAGAIYGKARGKQGQSYAIVTKSLKSPEHPSIPFILIMEEIYDFYNYAIINKDDEFLVAYSGVDENLNGYTPAQMAVMFAAVGLGKEGIPDNVVFEDEFAKLIEGVLTLYS